MDRYGYTGRGVEPGRQFTSSAGCSGRDRAHGAAYATVLALLNTRDDGPAELSTLGSHCSPGAHAAVAGTIRLIGTVEILAIRTG